MIETENLPIPAIYDSTSVFNRETSRHIVMKHPIPTIQYLKYLNNIIYLKFKLYHTVKKKKCNTQLSNVEFQFVAAFKPRYTQEPPPPLDYPPAERHKRIN